MRKLKNAKETIEMLGISMSKLYKLTHQRELKHLKIFGRLRFREEDIQKFLEEHSIEIATKDELERKANEL